LSQYDDTDEQLASIIVKRGFMQDVIMTVRNEDDSKFSYELSSGVIISVEEINLDKVMLHFKMPLDIAQKKGFEIQTVTEINRVYTAEFSRNGLLYYERYAKLIEENIVVVSYPITYTDNPLVFRLMERALAVHKAVISA